MTFPLSSREVTSPFGWRIHPVTQQRKFHNGIDLRASDGTAIRAPFPGKVAMTSTRAGGTQLILTHPGGLVAGFAHLSQYADGLKPGDEVKEGDIVAYTGHSGIGTGPHLHFTMSVKTQEGRKFFDPRLVQFNKFN